MDLPREVIKWLQYLNLSYTIKSVKDISNGVVVAEILNVYIPQSVHMNSLENGLSKEIKKKNWRIIKNVLTSCNITFEEKLIIDGDKNEMIDLMIKLYELFNQQKNVKETCFENKENDDLKTPSYARPTISQKVRESNVHDIVDEQQKMMQTHDVVEKEEKYRKMLKEKIKQDKEKSNYNKSSVHRNDLEHISSIATIPDMPNNSNYTEIHTMGSFVKNKHNMTLTTLASPLKGVTDNVIHPSSVAKIYEDGNIDSILVHIVSEHISDNDLKIPVEKSHNKVSEKTKGAFPLYKFLALSDETANNLCNKFHIICLSNKKDVVNKILDQLTQFNEKFQRILSLKTYQFTHLWKMFFPIITNSACDDEIRVSVKNYLKQFFKYLQINDVLSMEMLCNVILRSLFLVDDVQKRELKYFCELLILLINDDKHICVNILHMVKNLMPIAFFYVFLSTLLDNWTFSCIQEKDIKDIFFYYIFVGLHSSKSEIIWYTMDIIYTLSESEECEDLIYLSDLLCNITKLNNSDYHVFLFIIAANIIAKLRDGDKKELYKNSLDTFIQICSIILEKTTDGELKYLYYLHSYKIIPSDQNILEKILTIYENLSIEDQQIFFTDDIFEGLFKNICSYKLIEEKFSKVFGRSINDLNKRSNEIILQSLLNKNCWEKKSHVRFLKNTILYDGCITHAKFLEIYEATFKSLIYNLFDKNKEVFEISKDMLDCFWHWPHKTTEINLETFKISSNFLTEIYSEHVHQLSEHTKEYFTQLEREDLIILR